MDTQARISQMLTPLILQKKFAALPPQHRKQYDETIAEQLKEYTQDEITVMKKYLDKIYKMYVDAGILEKS